jgi:hypothetical protein
LKNIEDKENVNTFFSGMPPSSMSPTLDHRKINKVLTLNNNINNSNNINNTNLNNITNNANLNNISNNQIHNNNVNHNNNNSNNNQQNNNNNLQTNKIHQFTQQKSLKSVFPKLDSNRFNN